MALVHAGLPAPVQAGVNRLWSAVELAASDRVADARAAVVAASPGEPSHEANRARILAFLDSHPDALHRSCLEGHLTGSAAVIDASTGRVLLLLHRKVQRWLQPGGHADGDGNLARVALREAQEETGINGLRVLTPAVDLDVHVFRSAAAAEPDHLHLDVRHLVLAPPDALAVTNHESDGVRWVPVDEIDAADVDPGTIRMVHAAMAALTAL